MMRSAIAYLLCVVAVAQLSCLTVEAFSLLGATSVVAPSKAKAKRAAPAAAAKKKTAVKKVQVTKKKKPVAKKAAAKAKPKSKVKAAAKAKPKPKAKAKAAPKKKIVVKKAPKRKIQTTTSATAANVANSGTDAALAITKNFKPKKVKINSPLFPGLQSTASKKSSPKKTNNDSPKVKGGAAKGKGASTDNGAVNPISFGLRVAQSEKGKEAASVLIDGGLKLVTAILEEGKKTKVVIPQVNAGTGDLKKAKVTNVGLPQLIDAGIFAGTEFFDVAKSNYNKFYVGGSAESANDQLKVTRTPPKIDKKTGKQLAPAKENYVLKIGGERVLVNRPSR